MNDVIPNPLQQTEAFVQSLQGANPREQTLIIQLYDMLKNLQDNKEEAHKRIEEQLKDLRTELNLNHGDEETRIRQIEKTNDDFQPEKTLKMIEEDHRIMQQIIDLDVINQTRLNTRVCEELEQKEIVKKVLENETTNATFARQISDLKLIWKIIGPILFFAGGIIGGIITAVFHKYLY